MSLFSCLISMIQLFMTPGNNLYIYDNNFIYRMNGQYDTIEETFDLGSVIDSHDAFYDHVNPSIWTIDDTLETVYRSAIESPLQFIVQDAITASLSALILVDGNVEMFFTTPHIYVQRSGVTVRCLRSTNACETIWNDSIFVRSDIWAVVDTQDDCPDDPYKEEVGVCGCGVPDIDTDG